MMHAMEIYMNYRKPIIGHRQTKKGIIKIIVAKIIFSFYKHGPIIIDII